MAVDQKILREYLVALGIKIDERGEKKIDSFLHKTDLRVLGLGKGLVGLATTVVAVTAAFAKSMERMYYSARYADTTVSSLQALEYGTRQIGLEAGRGAGALRNMSAAIRSNPGLVGLLNSLGVEVKGRDKADVLVDLVSALKKMPFFVAERYANLFGIDQETLFYLEEGLDKMKQAAAQRKAMEEEMGANGDRFAEAGKEYMQIWRETTERAKLFGMVLAESALHQVQELAGVTNEMMKDWARIVKSAQQLPPGDSLGRRFREGLTGQAEGPRVKLTPEAEERLGINTYEHGRFEWFGIPRAIEDWRKWKTMRDRKQKGLLRKRESFGDAGDLSPGGTDYANVDAIPEGAGDTSPGGVDQPGFDPAAYLRKLEMRYGLPPGILDRVWNRESHRGDPRFMRSPKGAMGHFGFMPATAKEYGLKDPDDFKQSADAAARKWSDLMKRYGDTRRAAAAYNWGDGNLAQYGLGNAPKETRDYMDAVAGPTLIEAKPEIHIHGVSDPGQAADRVVQGQRTVNADIVRNMSPKVR